MQYWSFSYRQRVARAAGATTATVFRDSGQAIAYNLINGVWVGAPDVAATLEMSADGLTWIFTLPDQTREYFETSNGRLKAIRNPQGLIQSLTYDPGTWNFTVTAPGGDSLHVTMNSNLLTPLRITDAQGRNTSYTYDTYNIYLKKVTYPNYTARQYVYGGTYAWLITSVIDENGRTSNTVTYDDKLRATSSSLAGNAEKVTVSYNDIQGTSTVTDSLGKQTVYSFQTIHGVRKITHIEGIPTTSCQGTGKDFAYDGNGYLIQKIDALGTITRYTRDNKGLELSRTIAVGTPEERVITTEWNSALRLPLLITEGNRQRSFIYDQDGRLLSQSVTDTSLGISRTISYSYTASGQLAAVDGPRTDLNDTTIYSYGGNDELLAITNALGHVTTIVSRDSAGRPTLIRDANNIDTALAYDVRGRLISITVGGELTTLTYDGVGNITKVTPPNGAVVNYGYDTANRLIKITDASGNYLSYTLDLQGNRTAIKLYNSSAVLLQSQSRVYDELSRLIKSIGAANQTSVYSYDKNDNLVSITDPLGRLYQNSYDALNRLIQQTNPLNGNSLYAYDTQNRVTAVTDPNGHTTSYGYNALGDLLTQSSPDSGTTSYSYDSAGNLASRTDAKGYTTRYSYDALNRLTQQSFSGGSAISYSYDSAANGIGHLASSTTANGTTSYSYDSHGRLAARIETVTANGLNTQLATNYSYNVKGQLQSMTYPSGRVVGYQYTTQGLLSAMTLDGQTLLSAITWQPFGAVKGWTWGNGKVYSRLFNLDGRITSHTAGSGSKSLGYDANGNITATGTALYGYDALNRLVAANDAAFAQSWSYDANGNRLTMNDGGINTSYSIDSWSNRLQSSNWLSFQYDANGSLTDDTIYSYQYDAQGRLTSVNNGQVGQYRYNADGQRIYKWGTTQGQVMERLFAWDGWRLLGEYATSGFSQETYWLDDMPVALSQGGVTYLIHPDHLGTPRIITDSANVELWRWDGDPFGTTPANEDPDNNGVKFSYNLRFPGQYFDAETGKHYNYFRDYDPATGRYVESDPIGLMGGLNTYAYVLGDPLNMIDVNGERGFSVPVRPAWRNNSQPTRNSPLRPQTDAYLRQEHARQQNVEIARKMFEAAFHELGTPLEPYNTAFSNYLEREMQNKLLMCPGK